MPELPNRSPSRARDPQSKTPTQVRYVRGGIRPPTVASIQEWKSDLTGRSYEVFETHSFERTERLSAGAYGYLRYRNGAAFVTRNPGDPLPSEPVTPRKHFPANSRPPADPPSNIVRWLKWGLPGVLVILVLWHLVGG